MKQTIKPQVTMENEKSTFLSNESTQNNLKWNSKLSHTITPDYSHCNNRTKSYDSEKPLLKMK